jgi:hypothetical protein
LHVVSLVGFTFFSQGISGFKVGADVWWWCGGADGADGAAVLAVAHCFILFPFFFLPLWNLAGCCECLVV